MGDNTAVGLIGPRAKFLAVARRGWNRRTFAHITKFVFVRRGDLTAAQRQAHDAHSDWLLNANNREKVALLMKGEGDRDDDFDDWEYVGLLHDWSGQDWDAAYGVIVPDAAFATMLVDHGPFDHTIQYDPAFLNPGDVANIFDADGELLYNGGGRKYREICKFKLPPVREPDDDDEPAAKKTKHDLVPEPGPAAEPAAEPEPEPAEPAAPTLAPALAPAAAPAPSMPAPAPAPTPTPAAADAAVIDLTSESDEAPFGPWTCETCTVFHGEEGEFRFLACKICGDPRDPRGGP